MLDELKIFADALRKQELRDILQSWTPAQKAEFVNSTRTLDVVAQKICQTVA